MKIENEHLAAPVGSVGWWKTVNDITQRCTHSNSVVLDNTFANQLNDYFHELCPDLMWLSGAKSKYLKFLRGLFGKVLATSHERLRVLMVLMAYLFGFGRNMLRF